MLCVFIASARLNQLLCYLQPKAVDQVEQGAVMALGKCRVDLQSRFPPQDSSHHKGFFPSQDLLDLFQLLSHEESQAMLAQNFHSGSRHTNLRVTLHTINLWDDLEY